MFDDYWVAILIITIVGFLISIALSFYFIFLPSVRAQGQFEIIVTQGSAALSDITNLINTDTQLAAEIGEDSCKSLIYAAMTITKPPQPGGPFCPLPGQCPCQFIPQYCCQFVPLGVCDIPVCTPGNTCTT